MRTYIVISQRDDITGNPYPERLCCKARTWRDVRKCGSGQGTLVQDFLASLGQFGVRCCRGINSTMTENMKLIPSALDACRIVALFDCVAAQAAVAPKTEDDIKLSTRDEGYFGRHFTRKGAFALWTDFVGGDEDALSWFGYGAYAGGSLNVGFYCGVDRIEKVRAVGTD